MREQTVEGALEYMAARMMMKSNPARLLGLDKW
jgi:hypothetical protein